MRQNTPHKNILILGATGYVGGRLVPQLLDAGYHVKASGRSIDKLKSRYWSNHPQVELAVVDVLDAASLKRALRGVDIVYYLVHSMNAQSKNFESADRRAAKNMVRISSECGLQRIIYLGGLGEDNQHLSKHLKSRHEVSQILKSGTVPVTVLRAAMIIGSGSASFEILRYLVERLPIMITPRWVKTPNQPIAIKNVIEYLHGLIEKDETAGQTYDIGGKEILTYLELMRIYAQEAGLKRRLVIPVPVLTPTLSSLWIHLVTPIPSYIARPLAEGLRNPVVCHDSRIRQIIPVKILNCREAVRMAIHVQPSNHAKTSWTDADWIPPCALAQTGDAHWAGGTVLQYKRSRLVHAPKEKIWQVITRVGGETGWYHGIWLWGSREFIDRLVGGIGLSRRRRNAVRIGIGSVFDFWIVVGIEDNSRLILAADQQCPGIALLEFDIKELEGGQCRLSQKACFRPHGLLGISCWYVFAPFHALLFGGMVNNIARLSLREETRDEVKVF